MHPQAIETIIYWSKSIFRKVDDILVVNRNYDGEADGSITLKRGDLVEVLKTSVTENGANGVK